MKLRLRQNSLRLRVNQREVANLAAGAALEERLEFPGGGSFTYVLEASPTQVPEASFQGGIVRVLAPRPEIQAWAANDSIGIYFDLSANGAKLKVAIEKDLECVEARSEERDPYAFSRGSKQC
jgi:hypothetical protein